MEKQPVPQTATKKPYVQPQLKLWGTVTDLTQTGRRTGGRDAKGGTVPSRGR